MTTNSNIPKTLDTPQKQREWFEACEQIRKQKEYVRFYKHEITLAKNRLQKAEKELKDPKALEKKSEQKMLEKFTKQLKQHQGRDIRMELYFAYDIKYRYFKMKQAGK